MVVCPTQTECSEKHSVSGWEFAVSDPDTHTQKAPGIVPLLPYMFNEFWDLQLLIYKGVSDNDFCSQGKDEVQFNKHILHT